MATVKVPKFKAEDRIESLFDVGKGSYPIQVKETLSEDLVGEYRGYYPGEFDAATGAHKGIWKPKSSQRGGRVNGSHNGADIYTGYGPFPVETPILAATSGYLINLHDSERPNGVGNRVAISSKIGKEKIDFRYGHLSRFARPTGKVEKGDIIGYAGCSGNADTAGECTEVGPCGLTSCHVHLVTAVNGSFPNAPDPIAMLGWSLGYGAGADTSKTCAQIKPTVEPHQPARAQGSLSSAFNDGHKRSAKGRRVPLKAPFANVHFDDSAMLRSAVAAFDNLKKRLEDTSSKHTNSQAKFGDDVRAYMVSNWVGELKHAKLEPKTVQGRALAVFQAEIDLLKANEDAEGSGGPTTRALLAAAKAAWVLCGGAAIREGMSNRTAMNLWTNSGHKKLSTKWSKRNSSPVSKHLSKVIERTNSKGISTRKSVAMVPHQCCVGVDGWAGLVASDHAQVAIHNTSLDIKSETLGIAGSRSAMSLDFGTVGLMQSIWPASLEEMFPKPAVGADTQAAARDFATQVSVCLIHLTAAYGWAFRTCNALALAKVDDPRRERAMTRLAEDLQKLHDLIQRTHASFLSLEGLTKPETEKRRGLIGNVIDALVAYNLVFLRAGERRSAERELSEPIAPQLSFLSFEPPKKPEPESP